MSVRSLAAFAAASFLGLALTGCPSPQVDVHEPVVVGIERPGGGVKKPSPEPVDTVALAKRLAETRARHLDELHAYWTEGAFPINQEEQTVANIFRDDEGHLCAVANMIWRDGLTDLVDATAEHDNLVRLADVHEGPLHAWVLDSGFTQEEIAMIQVPYMPYVPSRVSIETERLQSHLAEVERRLRDDTPQSLKVAARRWIGAKEPARAIASR